MIEAQLREILAGLSPALSPEAVEHVEYYLGHGEPEMAYESFVLSLAAEKVHVPDGAKSALFTMGIQLGLDKESVFAANFWGIAEALLKP